MVRRAGWGAHFRLPIHSLGWEDIYVATRALKVYLADMQGSPCWQMDFSQPLALIVGGEAEGATDEARRLADMSVSIPMPGRAESLNAGVAGAILMFEVVRQRKMGK
jgi:TrmH family RNA methyltransferase